MSNASSQARRPRKRKKSVNKCDSDAEEDMKTVRPKMRKVKSSTDGVQLKLESSKTRIESVETRSESVKTESESVKTKIESVGTEIGSVKTRIESVKTKIESVETEIESVKTEIESVKTEIESVKTEIQNVETEMESVKTELFDIETNIKKVNGKIAEIDMKITNAGKDESEPCNAKSVLMSALIELKDDRKIKMRNEDYLREKVGDLRKKERDLRKNVEDLRDYHKELRKREAELSEEMNSLTGKTKAVIVSEEVITLSFSIGLNEKRPWTNTYPFLQLQHVNEANVRTNNENNLIYIRSEVERLWDKLDDVTGKSQYFFEISGFPGIGKSCTTWAWACWKTYQNKNEIIWISGRTLLSFIHWRGASGSVFRQTSFQDTMRYINSVCSHGSVPIIILDSTEVADEYQDCLAHLARVIVLVSKGIVWRYCYVNPTDRHSMQSWTLDDYIKACENKFFYDGIKKHLVSTSDSTDKTDLIKERYYYAGHCARFFFLSQGNLDQYINETLQRIQNPVQYGSEIVSIKSKNIVHHFLASVNSQTCIVSEYFNKFFLLNIPYKELEVSFRPLFNEKNPSLNGTLFEFLFVAQLQRKHEVTLLDEQKGKEERWTCQSCRKVEPTTMSSAPTNEEWLIPQKWNQAVYDLLQLRDQLKTLRIVQITKAKYHSYRLDVVEELLTLLKNVECEIKHVDFVVVYSTCKPQMQRSDKDKNTARQLSCKDYTTKKFWKENSFRYLKFSLESTEL